MNVTLRTVVRRRSGLAAALIAAAALSAAALLLGSCQAMFTYSPLSGLKRPPSSMTPAQRLTYAQDALASGNTADMKAAYDAIKNDSGASAQYTTAQLGIQLSGVPQVLVQIAADPSTVTSQLNTIDAFITSHGLDPTYMVAAAAQLAAAQAAGATLSTMDYLKSLPHMFVNSPVRAADFVPSGPSVDDRPKFSLPTPLQMDTGRSK